MLEQTFKIVAVPDKDDERGYYIELAEEKHLWARHDVHIIIGEHRVVYDPPEMEERELALKAIETMEARQQKILADAHIQHEKLQKKIESLKYLTHSTDVVN